MMHPIQEKLLRLSKERNLGQLSLRQIGVLIDSASPQKVKHHLDQLEKKGLIRIDRVKGVIQKTQPGLAEILMKKARLLVIPILGSANAGPAELFAEENIDGFLKVSSTIVKRGNSDGLFAIKVSGPSMNQATIDGRTINDGDYIIVDSNDRFATDGDIILSIIDKMANIKRFRFDKENNQIVLVSESTQNFAPVYIHPDDDYMINGKVIQVVKKLKTKIL